MDSEAKEVNFDGIVGPTHNYSGLSYGNMASEINQFNVSNPKEAALQGLEKMKFLADKGILQAVLPPQERPFLPILKQLGFSGDACELLKIISQEAPELLLATSSAAAMWTANAATVSPSSDSIDSRVHITPANLSSKFHRSIESSTTAKILKKIFSDPQYFIHHAPLPAGAYFSDEGAANHARFCQSYGKSGVQLFVYGRSAFLPNSLSPKYYPARQTKEASQAIFKLHRLKKHCTIFAQQHPDAIDAGAFHNDVVSVSNQQVFLFHEQAFFDKNRVISEIKEKLTETCQIPMICLEVKSKDLSLQEAVSSYFFNSQLISLNDDCMALIAPFECQENPSIETYINSLILSPDNPINEVHYLNLRQSMRNGGGPACLRLRVVLTEEELAATHQEIFLNTALYIQLKEWINKHYRDRLEIKDLADPKLLEESHYALDDLTKILNMGTLYDFQK